MIGEKLDCKKFLEGYRTFETMTELVSGIWRLAIVWSWGANQWTKMNDFCLRFSVSGNHHKGYVFIVVNGKDLFDIYLTNKKMIIKTIIEDVFVEDLVDTIDNNVEKIPTYKF